MAYVLIAGTKEITYDNRYVYLDDLYGNAHSRVVLDCLYRHMG